MWTKTYLQSMSGAYAGVLAFVEGTEPAEIVVLVVVALVYAVVPAGLVYLAISRDGEETEGDAEQPHDGDREDVSAENEGSGA